jgi:sec-independent protein translocase protein TatB
MGKARRMAAEFQGQFNEALREAEMADIKKQFDDVTSVAKDMSPTNLLTSISKDAEDAMKIDPPAPTTPASPTPETFAEAEAHAPPPDVTPPSAPSPNVPDAKAS